MNFDKMRMAPTNTHTTAPKNNKRIVATPNRDERLLAEVDSFCPLCGNPLLINKDKNCCAKVYELAHIYPHSPNAQQLKALTSIAPPVEIEALDNLIPLCRNCHKTYDSFTSVGEYINLRRIKDRKVLSYSLKSGLATVEIESEIQNVLHGLNGISCEEITDLRLDPIPIKQKIPNGTFQNKIIQLTTMYYPFLREQFQQMDSLKSNTFSIIATQFKTVFLKASQQSFLLEDIFSQLTEWLKSKSLANESACEVVVAFFIHDCEVFNAFTE